VAYYYSTIENNYRKRIFFSVRPTRSNIIIHPGDPGFMGQHMEMGERQLWF